MDPLSIAASVIPLLEATGFITKNLFKFVKAHRTAESSISGLCQELSSLTTFLQAVDKASKQFEHGSLDSALVEDDLRREIEQALVNCDLSLGELSRLVQKIESYRQKGFGWKSRVAVALSIYENDLAAFRDKIHKSNWALQTILNTINVSLSLRNNRSQTQILFELGKLKSSIDEALRVSLQPVGGFSHAFGPLSDRLAGNLWHLAEAAKTFHTAATSTASTIRADHSSMSLRGWSERQGSLAGHFPAIKRERVEQFLQETSLTRKDTPNATFVQSTGHATPRYASPTPISPSARDVDTIKLDHPGKQTVGVKEKHEEAESRPEPSAEESEVDDDDDADLERVYRSGLRDLAIENVRGLNLERAIPLLKEVLGNEEPLNTSSRDLRVQLAICYFMKGCWDLAEPLVTELARYKNERDLVVCELLHALALAQLTHGTPESALKTCQQALQSKKRLYKEHSSHTLWASYHTTLGLLHVIYVTCGDSNRAEIFRRQIPSEFEYEHSESPRVFIAAQKHLVRALLMLTEDDDVSAEILDWILRSTEVIETSGGGDLDAEVAEPAQTYCDADDEASPVTPRSPLSPQAVRDGFARIFGRMMPRHASKDPLSRRPAQMGRHQKHNGKPKVVLRKPRQDSVSSDKAAERILSWIRRQPSLSRAATVATSSDRVIDTSGEWVTADDHLRIHQGQGPSESSGEIDSRLRRNFHQAARPWTSQCEAMDTAVLAELADTSRLPELCDTGLSPVEIITKHSHVGQRASSPSANVLPGSINHRTPKAASKQRSNNVLPSHKDTDLQITIGRVAYVLASIPTTKDSDRLHALKLELELLLHDLSGSNDLMLRSDIAATVEYLKGLEASKQQEVGADDSGYESSRSKDLVDEKLKTRSDSDSRYPRSYTLQEYINENTWSSTWRDHPEGVKSASPVGEGGSGNVPLKSRGRLGNLPDNSEPGTNGPQGQRKKDRPVPKLKNIDKLVDKTHRRRKKVPGLLNPLEARGRDNFLGWAKEDCFA